jgi:hypothetical protein
MKPQKKSCRCRGLGLDSGLDLAISRFIYSFDCILLLSGCIVEGFSSAMLHCKDPQRLFTTTYTILLHYTTEMHPSSFTLSDPGVVRKYDQ